MARKMKSKAKNKKVQKAKENREKLNQLASNRQAKAMEFIRNLGPDGYMSSYSSLCKDVKIERYSMATPDGSTPLLNNVNIKLDFGKKYGLVGKNGYGKTTLLNNIATYKIEKFPIHVRMLHVLQEREIDHENTVIDSVLKSDIIRTQLLEESNRLETLLYETVEEQDMNELQDALDEITNKIDQLNLSNSHSRAFKILMGLGFDKKMQRERVDSLSGGWRMRVELAKALFVEPDILLLDEPTNHLDFPAVLWLQEHLSNNFKNTIVIVSHDKMFIENVSTNIIHLNHLDKTLNYYKGNYSAFEAVRRERLQKIANDYRAAEVQIASIKEFITKFRDKGEKRAAQVQSKMKTLKKLEEEIPPKPRDPRLFSFKFPEPGKIDRNLITFSDVSFSYTPPKRLLEKVNLAVDMNSRVGVIGANGVGKSTLIKLLLGKLKPLSGEIDCDPKAKFAYFSQHHYDQLDLTTSAVEYLLAKFRDDLSKKDDQVQRVRRHLGRFGIQGDRQNQRMVLLSGGQKSRVAFAVMTYLKPNFLVMDEPTNHLDMETVDALIEAIEDFKGGVLVISHDTHFLSKAVNDFWAVTPEKIIRFSDFEEAKAHALRRRLGEATVSDSE